jgi:hypothetical protein
LIASANVTYPDEMDGDPRPWQSDDVKHLIRQRRDCRDPQQRRELSKRIYKLARKHASSPHSAYIERRRDMNDPLRRKLHLVIRFSCDQ